MRISTVELAADPDVFNALLDYSQGDRCIAEAVAASITEENGLETLPVTPQMAKDWVESWFDPDDLRLYVAGAYEMPDLDYPEYCENELIKGFVNTILQVYRLTQVG